MTRTPLSRELRRIDCTHWIRYNYRNMRRGRLFVVVGGLLSGGLLAVSAPFWYPQARTLFDSSHASPPVGPASPAEDHTALAQRVTEYWQARIANDARRSFQYEHPVQQAAIGEQTYTRRIGSKVAVQDFAILDIALPPAGDVADIRMKATYTYRFNIPGAKPFTVSTEFTDYWQKEAGTWYHVLDTQIIPHGRPVIGKHATSAGSSPDGDES